VDLELTPDQTGLQEAVRKLAEGRFPRDRVRALADRPGAVDRELWRELADLGVFSLRLPEADGGIGLGWADAALVFEELGRALVPGPLVWAHLAAGVVEGAATGAVVVGGMERDDGAGLVEHLDALDTLVVLDDGGIWRVDPSEVEADPVAVPLDPLTPVHRVTRLSQGERLAGAETAVEWRTAGAALASAFLLGLADEATTLAVGYARERRQFDRPIGSFQAVKHLLADMVVRVEVARAAVYAAGVTLDQPDVGPPARAVAAAKVCAADAAVGNAKTCVQVHGGMGFTWEVDAHLFLKRAYALEPVFGSRDEHADVMAGFLEDATTI